MASIIAKDRLLCGEPIALEGRLQTLLKIQIRRVNCKNSKLIQKRKTPSVNLEDAHQFCHCNGSANRSNQEKQFLRLKRRV